MKKCKLLVYSLLLFFNVLSISAKPSKKAKSIVFEVAPEFNMLFFSNDPIGGKFFHSTQLRTSLGISWKKKQHLFLMGIEFLMPHQFFHENSLEFYRLGFFTGVEKPLTRKISFSFKIGMGIYNFKDQDDPIIPYLSFRTGLGYYITDDFMLTLEIDVPIRGLESNSHLDGTASIETKMNILNISLGVRYYFDLL